MRARALIAVAALVWSLGACSDPGYWALRDDTDLAMMEELRQDPWLVPAHTESAFVPLNVPADSDYWMPGRARGYGDRVQVPVPRVVAAQVAAAERAGWWPFYAVCTVPSGHELDGPPEEVLVRFARELSTGVLAQADLTVSQAGGGSGDEPPTDVYLEAEVPSHHGTRGAAPEAVDVTGLACLGSGTQGFVGEPIDLLEEHR